MNGLRRCVWSGLLGPMLLLMAGCSAEAGTQDPKAVTAVPKRMDVDAPPPMAVVQSPQRGGDGRSIDLRLQRRGQLSAGQSLLATHNSQASRVEVYDVNGQRVIVQVNSRLDADMGAFEDDSALLRQRMVYMEQMEFVQAWRDSLIAAAEVERLI